MPRRIESHWIAGPEGNLEAILEEPEDGAPREAALVCHPHPLYGGTMHNKVVYRIARGLRSAGSVVLRFNFRGVGRSEGSHAHGVGEIEDARAALAWLGSRYPGLPVTLAGFSFGSRVVTRLGCGTNPQLGGGTSPPLGGGTSPRRIIAVGFPTENTETGYLESCVVPKVFIQSTHDEHCPRAEMERLFLRFGEPKELIWIEGRDHFFADALDMLERTVAGLG